MTAASTPTVNRRKVAELIKGVRIAMLATMDGDRTAQEDYARRPEVHDVAAVVTATLISR